MIKPYNTEADKKAEVSAMFDNIAPKYDFLNRFLSLGIDVTWRNKMVSLLKKDQPKIVLDVATGTADVALTISKILNPDKIIGVDISPQMLKVGREKIDKQNLNDKITLLDGDSENLNFGDNYFDAITVAFGVRNFENLDKGLAEMFRVLKPNGKLIVLEFTKPNIFPFKQLYHFYFKNVLPLIGKLTSKDSRAYTYLYESVMAFPERESFLERMKGVGFSDNNFSVLTLGICSIYSGTKK